eukprot:564402-Rhodomonas_salina.1
MLLAQIKHGWGVAGAWLSGVRSQVQTGQRVARSERGCTCWLAPHHHLPPRVCIICCLGEECQVEGSVACLVGEQGEQGEGGGGTGEQENEL